MKKLTIVIPVYNGAGYIQGCLKNLEAQTYRDWEAIFVNDGSTDETMAMLERYAAPHEKCRVIHKQNGGTAQTRNAGLEIVDSLYVISRYPSGKRRNGKGAERWAGKGCGRICHIHGCGR